MKPLVETLGGGYFTIGSTYSLNLTPKYVYACNYVFFSVVIKIWFVVGYT